MLVTVIIFSGDAITHYRFLTSAALARVDTARGIHDLLVYLDISTSGRRTPITTSSNSDRSLSGMRVKCEVLQVALQTLIIHETPLPRSAAQSHETTRRCATLNSCVGK